MWQFAVPVFSLKRTIWGCMLCFQGCPNSLQIIVLTCYFKIPNYGSILWRCIFKNIIFSRPCGDLATRCNCPVFLKCPVGNSTFCYRIQLVARINIKAVNRLKIIFWLWLYILFWRFCLFVLPSPVLNKWIVNRSWEVVFLNRISRRHLQG